LSYLIIPELDYTILNEGFEDCEYFWQIYEDAKKLRNNSDKYIESLLPKNNQADIDFYTELSLKGKLFKNLAAANVFYRYFADLIIADEIIFEWEYDLQVNSSQKITSYRERKNSEIVKEMQELYTLTDNGNTISDYLSTELSNLRELNFFKKYKFLSSTFFSIRIKYCGKERYFVLPFFVFNTMNLFIAIAKSKINTNPPKHPDKNDRNNRMTTVIAEGIDASKLISSLPKVCTSSYSFALELVKAKNLPELTHF
jgi:hypothetical protein